MGRHHHRRRRRRRRRQAAINTTRGLRQRGMGMAVLDVWDMALNGTETTGTITSTVNAAGCVGAGHGCSNMQLCAQCFVDDMQCAAASPSWGGNDDALADLITTAASRAPTLSSLTPNHHANACLPDPRLPPSNYGQTPRGI